MLATEIFKESPFKALKLLGMIFGAIFLLFSILFFSDETPGMTADGLNKSAFAMVLLAAVFGGGLLLTFLILSFQRRKTVKCDLNGCEISQRNFWGIGNSAEQLKWIDVTDTNIMEGIYNDSDGGEIVVYTFAVETDQGPVGLMDLKTSSKRNIEGLINYVNNAVPSSQCVWVKGKDRGNRKVLSSGYGFSKVSRDS